MKNLNLLTDVGKVMENIFSPLQSQVVVKEKRYSFWITKSRADKLVLKVEFE